MVIIGNTVMCLLFSVKLPLYHYDIWYITVFALQSKQSKKCKTTWFQQVVGYYCAIMQHCLPSCPYHCDL